MEYPDYCYQGAYVTELAKTLPLEGVSLTHIDKAKSKIQGQAIGRMLSGIKRLIRQVMKIHYDRFFLESELYKKKIDQRMLKLLRDRDLVYEQDGALWMKTSQFGDDKDRVLIKANGEKTYFLSDVAYLWEKFAIRRFDRAILLLGADHHGYVNRMQAVTTALGWPGKLEVKIFQLVRLMDNGKEVRMSKRSGTFVTLDELVNDVGLDVARFFFLMVGPGTHMDFDLNLAKEHSEKNPVFYVQYAHARISSILKNTRPLLRKKKVEKKSPLSDPSAFTLIKTLLEFPELVDRAAKSRTVSELPTYAIRLATDFHNFYTKVRIISDDVVQLPALELAEATKLVLAQTLGLLGVRAPEKM
jgi:arginyl-tRNA synthetase